MDNMFFGNNYINCNRKDEALAREDSSLKCRILYHIQKIQLKTLAELYKRKLLLVVTLVIGDLCLSL